MELNIKHYRGLLKTETGRIEAAGHFQVTIPEEARLAELQTPPNKDR